MIAQASTIRSTSLEPASIDVSKHMQGCIVKRRKKNSSTANSRPHMCEVEGCNRTFENRQTCKEHGRKHSGQTPYVCPVLSCGRRFKWRSSLASHKKTHVASQGLENTAITTTSANSTISSEGTSNGSMSSLLTSAAKNNAGSAPVSRTNRINVLTGPSNDKVVLASIREICPSPERADYISGQQMNSLSSLTCANDLMSSWAPSVPLRFLDRSLLSLSNQPQQPLSPMSERVLPYLSTISIYAMGTRNNFRMEPKSF
eukprot:Plantae.Rhodophyta-Purpureofilum_apyrenoidigerum.ctg9771.p1 GENE.Plantae.Rhodophyta-Purpureofilum_apyrenoidigerum.ctg9771~~Plantae.Rhodophyta-Purpureofilum_apyrenoidigerum.ctg9771.p1  ORF type:complete len:258 (-),score=18.25 Plantae.Rhodophyta-Purpureofilum_apyrenoidigerum.ctg9771:286-1059(-)